MTHASGAAVPAAVGIRSQRAYLALAGLVAVLWLALLPLRPLFNPDEGRYAEIPREMLLTGDWVIPHLNGLAYIEKPPLQFWATAVALRAFGTGEFAVRLYTACCALATLTVGWWVGKALWGTAAAWRAVAVLSSMLLFVVLGQLLTLDMSLTLYMTLSLAGFLLAQRPRAPGSAPGRRFMIMAWIAAALGVLTKGLVAAAIPAAVLILYSLCCRDFSPWRRLHVGVGLPLFLAITVPWHWLAAVRVPGFVEFYFVREHLERYLTSGADRVEAWWFFGAVFVLGCLPWTVSAVRVVALDWRGAGSGGGAGDRFDARRFLWIWVVFIGGFFSLSDSKLIPYLLPALPAVALLVAASPEPVWRRDLRITGYVTLFAAVATALAASIAPGLLSAGDRSRYFSQLARPMAEIAALLAAAGCFAVIDRYRDPTRTAVLLGASWCLAGLLLMRAAALVAPIYSGAVLAHAVRSPQPAEPVYSIGMYDQTLPFYWQHAVTLVHYRGELDFGLQLNPAAELPTVDAFVDEWRHRPDGYAIMEDGMFEYLGGRGVPMHVRARAMHRVLVTRR